MNLKIRVDRLEQRAVEDLPPLPALVRFANTPGEEAAAERELATMPKGTQLVLLVAKDCSRKGEV